VSASSRGADRPDLERADQREVEQPLGLRANRLGVGRRRLELGDHGAAVAQEGEEPLEERVGLRGQVLPLGSSPYGV
jgi:hypothetical protein